MALLPVAASPTRPAATYANVSASDTVNFDPPARAVRFGSAGDAELVDMDGNVTTFVGILAGELIPGQCLRVNSNNLTAGNIVAFYA